MVGAFQVDDHGDGHLALYERMSDGAYDRGNERHEAMGGCRDEIEQSGGGGGERGGGGEELLRHTSGEGALVRSPSTEGKW